MSEQRTIRQIVAAQGWFAVYATERKAEYAPVAVWAMIRGVDTVLGDRWTEVQGMVSVDRGLEPCEEAPNFVGYVQEAEKGTAVVSAWVDEYLKHKDVWKK
jgi:hypothetical protein